MSEEEKLTGERKVSISQLKTGKIWCNWVWYTTKTNKKTKRPLSKVNDPNTWLTYEQAVSGIEWNNADGIGLMFAPNRSGVAICGIDIDAHHVETNPLSKEIMEMFKDTYIEQSPSGKGYHILFFAELTRLPDETTYKDQYQQKNSTLDVECYISGMTNRYFTFTGKQVSEGDFLTNKTDTLLEFLNKYMRKALPPVSSQEQPEQRKLTEGREDKTPDISNIDVSKRLQVAMKAKNGSKFTALYNGDTSNYKSTSEAVQAFVDILVFYFGDGGQELVKRVFLGSGLAVGKWAERDTIIDTTINNAFQRVSDRYKPPKKKAHREEERSEKKPVLNDYFLFEQHLLEKGHYIRYNEITHAFEYLGFDDKESQDHLPEVVPSILQDELEQKFSRVTTERIKDYITRFATRHKYNPILQKIQAVEWDGKNHLEALYEILGLGEKNPVTFEGDSIEEMEESMDRGAEEREYSRIFVKKWLMQCICGLYNTTKNPFSLDLTLVILGKQGIGKTRLFEKLALGYFAEGVSLNIADKDIISQATSKFITELGEISSTLKRDTDTLKAFLSKSQYEYRLPYGRTAITYPRMTSFCGSTNEDIFLEDPSGNRRYAIIEINDNRNRIDEIKKLNVLQLWAQVYELVKNEDKASCFRLTADEAAYLEKRNKKYTRRPQGVEDVLTAIEEEQLWGSQPGYRIVIEEISPTDFKNRHDTLRHCDPSVIGRHLSTLGYKSESKKVDGKTTRLVKLPIAKFFKCDIS